MSEIYPYCSHCESKLTKKEIEENEKIENLYYPICDKCLEKHTKNLIDIVSANKKTSNE